MYFILYQFFLNIEKKSKFIFRMRNFLVLGDEERKANSPDFCFMLHHKKFASLFLLHPNKEKRFVFYFLSIPTKEEGNMSKSLSYEPLTNWHDMF